MEGIEFIVQRKIYVLHALPATTPVQPFCVFEAIMQTTRSWTAGLRPQTPPEANLVT
jgi:hypothetical protein